MPFSSKAGGLGALALIACSGDVEQRPSADAATASQADAGGVPVDGAAADTAAGADSNVGSATDGSNGVADATDALAAVADATMSAPDVDSGGCPGDGATCPTRCPAGSPTTIQGVVLDPAGNDPLPFVVAYVPARVPLTPLPAGAHCDTPRSLYPDGVVASAMTGADGSFTIQNAPDGPSVPLVIQAGKWRRLYTMSVTPCQPNTFSGVLRLPRDSSEGDLPDIAVSTGGADSLECLLTRVGVSDGEFVDGASTLGHVHVFQGGASGAQSPGPTIDGNTPASSRALWDTSADLGKYDVVLLSCEGAETGSTNPAALDDYVKSGGRVFASHFHYAWFADPSGPFPAYNLAQWSPGVNSTGTINGVVQTTLPNGGSFPQGQELHDWLGHIGALGENVADELPVTPSNFNAMVTMSNLVSTPWIKGDQKVASPGLPGMTVLFSWDEPIGAAEGTCGRVVYGDLHVGTAAGDYGGAATSTGGVVPTGCTHATRLSPHEAALEFVLFNLSSPLVSPGSSPAPP